MTERTGTTAVREVFDAALDVPAGGRRAFVVEACGGDVRLQAAVESLLAAHERAGEFLASPEVRFGQLPMERFAVGAKIGPYVLRKVIGAGGHGMVYLAEQVGPLQRWVALKVVKAGMDTRQIIARFELERQALAMMDHPNIARVLDAGATESGRPYFVMEYVAGKALTEFAREKRLGLVERLELFLDVCSAVRHAHQKGIIHRDLKPANVLVAVKEGEAVAKVIDFGIAKALRTDDAEWRTTLTQGPTVLGTPQYMSPEQAAGRVSEVDSRTDVYSLGVMLYELLTGMPPFDPRALRGVGAGEVARILREVDPVVPSAALRKLSGTLLAGSPAHAREVRQLSQAVREDLDWITMKAMEKERERRYESVEAMMGDVERFLRSEPVTAGRPGGMYRMRKFVRRHRGALGMVGIAAVALGAGLGLAFWLEGRGAERVEVPVAMTREVASAPASMASSAAAVAGVNLTGLAPGIVARFYSGSAFEKAVAVRVDASIDHSWARGKAPAPGVSVPKYSIRWEGVLVAPAEGVEGLELSVDDGAEMWVDGVEVLRTVRPAVVDSDVHLKEGRHSLRVDYWNSIAQGHAQLRWRVAGKGMGPIPAGAFFYEVGT